MINISEYVKEDKEDVDKMIAEFQDFEIDIVDNRLPGKEISSQYREYLIRKCREDGGRFLIARLEDNTPVGYIAYWVEEPDTAFLFKIKSTLYVSDLFIVKEHRSKGIGGALLKLAYDSATRLGLKAVTLNVLTNNYNAISVYEKHGFKETDRMMIKII